MSTPEQAFVPGPSERGLEVRYYADLLWRGRLLIVTTALVGLGLGLLVAFLQTAEYQAGAMVQIDPPPPTFLSVTDALMGAGNYLQNNDFYNTQFQILHSRTLGSKVVERLKLKDQPPFRTATEPGALLMSHVTIEPVPETRLVMIQVVHTDPKEAALWANALADIYIEESLSNRVEAARRAYEWLQGRLAATQQAMSEAQNKLLKSYQSQDLFVPEGSVSAVTTSITKLNEDFIAAQSRRIVLEAALSQVQEMRRRGQSLNNVPQVSADSGVQALNAQMESLSVELSKLKEKYKAAHPEVQKVEAQIDQIRKQKDARANQIVDGMRAEYSQIQRREAELRGAIDEQKAQAATQSRKGTELETLKKQADSAKSLYEVLLQKLNETDIAASIRSNNVSLVERALPPVTPIRPRKRRIAAAALFAGLALGAALVYGRDYFSNTIKDPDEVERFLHLDLLAAVPRYDEANVHLVTEAYQTLRTAMIFGRKEEGGQVVLVTGTAPQEGKTTTLVNIAKLLASSGESTIVLDFDLRRANLHTRLGLTREPGLTSFFAQHESLDSLIRPTRIPNLYALTAGALPPNPPAILARKAVGDLLSHLRTRYEWVLLDSPPIASVTDGLLLARHADMVVLVVQHNKVDKKVVKRTALALRKVTANVLGAVLNAVDVKSQGYSYYYYHQDHGSAVEKRAARPEPKPVAAVKG